MTLWDGTCLYVCVCVCVLCACVRVRAVTLAAGTSGDEAHSSSLIGRMKEGKETGREHQYGVLADLSKHSNTFRLTSARSSTVAVQRKLVLRWGGGFRSAKCVLTFFGGCSVVVTEQGGKRVQPVGLEELRNPARAF